MKHFLRGDEKILIVEIKNLSRGDENLFQLDETFFKWDENLKYEMKILNVIKLFTNEMNFFFKWDEIFKLVMKNFI